MIFYRSIFLLALLAACSPSETTNPKNQAFLVHIGPEPTSLDWQKTVSSLSATVHINIMDGLFTYDLNSTEIQLTPQLVDTFKVSVDKKKWTFHLKDNVNWSDGTPLISQHFLDAFHRLLKPSTASPHAHRLFPIKNANKFFNGKVDFQQVGIKAPTAHTLTIETQQSFPELPHLLTGPFSYPIRKDLIEQKDKSWTLPSNFVGLGPYSYSNNQPAKETCLERNDKYYGRKPQLKRFCFIWLESTTTAQKLFEKGQLHLVKSPNHHQLSAKTRNKYLKETAGLGTYFLAFNHQKKIDKPTRQYILQTLNIKKIQKVAGNDVISTHSYIPQKILKTAPLAIQSVTPPFHLPKVRLGSNTTDLNRRVMESVHFQLKKLGFNVDIKLAEPTTYYNDLKENNDFDLFRLSWTPGLLSPLGYLKPFLSDSQNNFSHYMNSDFDKLVTKARTTISKKKRTELYKLAQQHLIAEAVLIPLFQHKQAFLINEKDWSLRPHPSERLEFKYATQSP